MCKIIKIPNNYYRIHASYKIGREFPLIERARVFTTKLRTTGYLIHEFPSPTFGNLQGSFNSKKGYDDSQVMEISFQHIWIIYLGYLTLLLVSIIILSFEILKNNLKKFG